jgi:hypothetical protein
MNLIKHLAGQVAFSLKTFGPGRRTEGVLNHIEKEVVEVRDSMGSPEEWVDIVILSLDGLLREIATATPHLTPHQAATIAAGMIQNKQVINEGRDWPDWRKADPNKAIEHVIT